MPITFRQLVTATTATILTWATLALLQAQSISHPRVYTSAVLTPLLLVLSLILPLICCLSRDANRPGDSLDLCQPGIVFAFVYYIYLVLPAFNIWYNFDSSSVWLDSDEQLLNSGLLVGLISICSFGIGYKFSLGRPIHDYGRRTLERLRAPWLYNWSSTIVLLIFIVAGLGARLYVIHQAGGFSLTTLEQLSPGIRRQHGYQDEIKVGMLLAFLEPMFDAGLLIWAFRRIESNRSRLFLVPVLLAGGIIVFFVSGKRTAVAPFLILPIVWSHYLRKRLSIRNGMLFAVVGSALFGVLLLARIFIPLFVLGTGKAVFEHTSARQGLFLFYVSSPEFATFDMVMGAIKWRDPLVHALGGVVSGTVKYNFGALLYFVPRAFWSDKPDYQDIGQVMFQYFITADPTKGMAVTIFGTAYLFGAFGGVAIITYVVGLMFRWSYLLFRPTSGRPLGIFLYGVFFWMAFEFLRFGSLGFTFLLFFQSLLVAVIGILLLWFVGGEWPSS